MEGIASFYGDGEKLNKHTASGEIFNPEYHTCAMWNLPFGTFLRVTCLRTGLSTVVRVNDRRPARRLDRLIDLTKRAFIEIADPAWGLIQVKVEIMERP